MIHQAPRASAPPAIALVGTYVPRACGIATFTRDLRAVLRAPGAGPTDGWPLVVALDHGGPLDPETYPPEVRHRLRRGDPGAIERVARDLDGAGVEIISLQHEFGIFGGHAGREVLALAAALPAPLVTTFHTVLARPRPLQHEVMVRLAAASARVVVMTERGRDLLGAVYDVPAARIAVVPHGVPDLPFGDPDLVKPALGLSGRRVILSFGLLSPNKGLELAIEALREVVASVPAAILVIAGRTHPEVRHRHGEAYRDALAAQAAALGLGAHVRFVDRYLEPAELAAWLAAADVFVTPYANAAQITSGTLAYAAAAGTAVVSTPYEHARELLADGRGVLVPFGDAAALGGAIRGLLTDDAARHALRRRAWLHGRTMIWQAVGARYQTLFASVLAETAAARPRPAVAAIPHPRPMPTEVRVATPPPERPGVPMGLAPLAPVARRHLERLRTPLGLYQHAIGAVPDPRHGFCTDDMARALVVERLQCRSAPGRGPAAGVRDALAFLEAAYSPASGRFRNFRAADGHWLEEVGSEDSHGRALQALGALIVDPLQVPLAARARALFTAGLPAARDFGHLRPRAYTVLGCAAALAAEPDVPLRRTLTRLAGGLADAVTSAPERLGWPWPERVVTYDNAMLPAALIAAGACLGRDDWLTQGSTLLAWLAAAQTAPDGHLRPVGNAGWWPRGGRPAAFDQQPLEVAALAEAARLAHRSTGEPRWAALVERAYAWFLGANDLGQPLAVPEDGSCCDGLEATGVNLNQGAESTLAWLLTVERVRALRARAATGVAEVVTGARIEPSLPGTRAGSFRPAGR